MNHFLYTIKRTPRGKHYCIVTIGKDVIYVSPKVYPSGEEAMTEAKNYLETLTREKPSCTPASDS